MAFIALSDSVVVSDPYYYKGSVFCLRLNIKSGTWSCNKHRNKDTHGFVIRLEKSYEMTILDDFQPLPFYLISNSGKIGIFDSSIYPSLESIEEGTDDLYETCCSKFSEYDMVAPIKEKGICMLGPQESIYAISIAMDNDKHIVGVKMDYLGESHNDRGRHLRYMRTAMCE
jgi:hypothetical protein